jgi:hypothetical protein
MRRFGDDAPDRWPMTANRTGMAIRWPMTANHTGIALGA